MELGLHRRETYSTMFTDDEGCQHAIRLFWSIYVLDRRWSFGTGLPFALQDADIDLLLPKPVRLVACTMNTELSTDAIAERRHSLPDINGRLQSDWL